MEGQAEFISNWELEGVGGVVVVIDVLRAFTTAAYAFAAGAAAIYLVGTVTEALNLARSMPGSLTMGEVQGRKPREFDLSNSPVRVANSNIQGRILVHRTSAGTQGVVAASGADRIFASSLVCASATAAAINRIQTTPPTYVITGRLPDSSDGGEEDLLAATLIEHVRRGEPVEPIAVAKAVAQTPGALRFQGHTNEHVHHLDVDYAVDVDRFDFAMEVERTNQHLLLVQRH
jgi:2-phosphosulfolactate phosphatase